MWYSFKNGKTHKVTEIWSGGRILREKSTIWSFNVTIRFPYDIDAYGNKIPKDYLFDFMHDFSILDTNNYRQTYRVDWGDGAKHVVGVPGLQHIYVCTRINNSLVKTFPVKIVADVAPSVVNKVSDSPREASITFGPVTNIGEFRFSEHKYEYMGV